jgi:hypothetical protein
MPTPTTLAAQVLAGLAGFPSPTSTQEQQPTASPNSVPVTTTATNGIDNAPTVTTSLGPITMAQSSLAHVRPQSPQQQEQYRPLSPRPKSPVPIAPAPVLPSQPSIDETIKSEAKPMSSQIPVRTSRSPSPKPVAKPVVSPKREEAVSSVNGVNGVNGHDQQL